MVVLVWRRSCPVAMCSVAPESSATASPHVGSKRQLAWCYLSGWHVFGKGLRTGERLHPGPAGERLLKQRPIVGCLEDVGIAGFTEEALCAVLSAAAFDYEPQQAAASNVCLGVLLQQGKGVRTGGRLHPGPAGERLPKQSPKSYSCSYGRPGSWLTGRPRCSFLDPGYETECAFFVLRSLAYLPACPLCLRTVFTCLPTPTGTLIGPPRPSACPSACLLPWAVLRRCPSRPRFSRLSCARSWEPGLRPPVDFATRCFSDHPTVINARVCE